MTVLRRQRLIVSLCLLSCCFRVSTAIADESARWHVVDRATIEAYDLRTVADALVLVPGLSAVRTHLLRDIPTVRGVLESHYANRVLVMIQGVPAWHATTGEGSLNRVSIEDVERIEVLAGPASVSFGSQAYAGVINLILRSAPPGGSGGSAYIGLGAPDQYDAGLRFGSAGAGYAWLVAGGLTDKDGREYRFSDESGTSGLVREFARTSAFTASGTYEAGGTHSLLINRFEFSESFFGPVPTFTQGLGHTHQSQGVLVSYGWSPSLGERMSLDTRLSYDHGEREFSRSLDDRVRANVEGRRVSASGVLTATLAPRTTVAMGADFDHRKSLDYVNVNVVTGDVLARNNMEDRSVWEGSVFGSYRQVAGRTEIDAGLRVTDNENFGAHTSLSGAVGYALRPDHVVRVRGVQSYRSPTLFELFFETAERTVFGNLDLQPETSMSVEAEYTGTLGNLSLRATAYRAQYDDQIVRARRSPDNPSDLSLVYVNGEDFSANGLEIEARYGDLFVSYGVVRGDDGERVDGAAALFRFVPDHTVTAGVSHAFGRLTTSGFAVYRSTVSGPTGAPQDIDGDVRVNLSLTYRHRRGAADLSHSVALDNATDSDWATPEYVRQNLNRIPYGFGRSLTYRLRTEF